MIDGALSATITNGVNPLKKRTTTVPAQTAIDRQHFYREKIRQCQDQYRNETGFARRYFIETYGCQLNENDSEYLSGLLDDMGYIPADSQRDADLIILNTCSIREHAASRLFGNLGHLKPLRREKPDLIIAVCGCMMKRDEYVERIDRSFSFVDIIFGPQDVFRLPEFLYGRLIDQRRVYAVGDEDIIIEGLPIHRVRRYRALVSIMFGCNNFCTYCVVPYTRGRERSRKPDEVLKEIRQLSEAGYQEIMLLGQNVNSYGHDLPADETGPRNFAQLLAAVAAAGSFSRIRFMTSHPKDLSDELIETMRRYPAIEPHVHLALQSGSNTVLKRMNRKYTRESFLDIVRKLRAAIPGITLSTDLIVGFPGETEAEFVETLDLMRQIRFDSAFTFQFSPREGTPAATMDNPVAPDIIADRFKRLTDLQNEHSLASNQATIGRSFEVLIEGQSSGDAAVLSGRTRCNRLVNLRVPEHGQLPDDLYDADGKINGDRFEGRLAQVLITDAKTFSLIGELEKLLL